ncbi:MAG: hypothetical protein LBC70_05320 [Chitinispirillales bacterium]|jgi:hypothetical protein|nr:hypothetical protein [Chitinispirillales bacterium]
MKILIICLLLAAAAFAVDSDEPVVIADDGSAVSEKPADIAVDSDGAVGEESANIAADSDNGEDNDGEPAVSGEPAGDDIAVDSDGPPAPQQRGLDLDKLLAEDDEEDGLLGEYIPAVVAKDTIAVDSLSASAESAVAADSAQTPVAGDTRQPGRAPVRRASISADTADLGPMVIEDGRTVNFAQNLAEYRSPRLAMLLSFLVPGLGQAYSRDYIKAGGFIAAEVAVIGVAAYLNSVGKSKKRDAHKFADRHFDVEQLREYDRQLLQEFERRLAGGYIDTSRAVAVLPWEPYDDAFYDAAANRETYFYETIRNVDFTPGWRDNEFTLNEIIALGQNDTLQRQSGVYRSFSDAGNLPEARSHLFYLVRRVADANGNAMRDEQWARGYSSYQEQYNSMMNDANSYHDFVNFTLYALVVNHIVSAIDAGFTARAHNARLLGRESAWNRISVEQQYVFTGSETSPGIAFRVKF